MKLVFARLVNYGPQASSHLFYNVLRACVLLFFFQDTFLGAWADLQIDYESLREGLQVGAVAVHQARQNTLDMAWLRQRRQVALGIRAALATRRQQEEQAREALLASSQEIQFMFPALADCLPWAEFARDALSQAADARRLREEMATSEARVNATVTASSHEVVGADECYRDWFARATGRRVEDGPPGLGAKQPPLHMPLALDDLAWARSWLERGGYSSAEQFDEGGWTALHHALLATVYYDQAHRVCRGLIRMMSAEWLGAKTRAGRPTGYTVLHMACNGSDCQFARADLVRLLIEGEADLEARNSRGVTPFLLGAGTGVVDVVMALSQAGCDVHAKDTEGGRNAADRCVGSSTMMTKCPGSLMVPLLLSCL